MNNSTIFATGAVSPFLSSFDTPLLSHVSSLNAALHVHSHALLDPYHPQSLFESGYRLLLASLSPYQIIVWLSWSLQVSYYFLFSLPSFLLPFLPFMQRYKLQPGRAAAPLAEQWKVLKHVMLSKTLIILPIALFGYEAFHYAHYDLPISYEAMPAWWLLTLQMVASLWIEDSWHYLMHRALHHPAVYGRIHKVHHTYAAPFSFAAEYAHPVETAILGIGFFLPMLLFFTHIAYFWLWLAVRMWETADVHSGYDVPLIDALNPLRLLPFYGGARFHDYHHKAFNTNYASTFHFWDRIFGTDALYQKHRQEMRKQTDKKVD